MAERRRARADQTAIRVNAAAELLELGLDLPEAARRISRRYRISERQARRYLETAADTGRVRIPRPKVVFAVKVENSLDREIRRYARQTGRSISDVASQAMEELLEKVRAGPRSAR